MIKQQVSTAADAMVDATAGPAPEQSPVLRDVRVYGFLALSLLALVGQLALAIEVSWWILASVLAVPLIWLLWRVWPWLALVGSPLFALLVLVGFNVVWHNLGIPRWDIGPGLATAVAVFTLSLFLYMRLLTRARWAVVASGVLSVLVVLGVPLLVGTIKGHSRVPAGPEVVSKLDVLLVTKVPGRGRAVSLPVPPLPTGVDGWSIRYSVARDGRRELRWALLDSEDQSAANRALAGKGPVVEGQPTLRKGADQVLLLVPDGTAPVVTDPPSLQDRPRSPGELRRWRQLAQLAAGATVPTFGLLQTQDEGRLALWRGAFGPTGGGAVSLQRLNIRALTDAGLRLAVRSPDAEEEIALAIRFRPIMRFDRRERLDEPVNINEFFASGRVELCKEDLSETKCTPIGNPSELTNDATHLRLHLQDLARHGPPAHAAVRTTPPPPGRASTIYVHAVKGEDDDQLLYLDYWWYLPLNPAGVGEGVFCGAGLAIADVTCFDHQSDWEGMTVVVDRSGPEPQPVAVHYAQHGDVVSYAWEDLASEWSKPSYSTYTAGIGDAPTRPLAFIAAGTHASYPTPCRTACRQVASNTGEASHDGNKPWSGNVTTDCVVSICVLPVPTRKGGTEPALWNAFSGPWGERHCVWRYYCDLGGAPGAPAIRHYRYDHPEDCDGRWEPSGRRRLGDACA